MFEKAFRQRLIYIFTIDDAAHRGLLKIGDTTFKSDMRQDAEKRIHQYTKTAGVVPKILYTELAVKDNAEGFRDYDVHHLLKKYKTKIEGTTAREWFKVDLKTAINAIAAVKQGKKILSGAKIEEEFSPITFRPEQKDAINKTVEYFQHGGKDFLWNAKMRFGKTLCALEVVHRMNFSKTIILTHRPVVNAGWFEDFDKIFHKTNYTYCDKESGIANKNFVYFASLQDLRGSQIVNDKSSLDKNSEVFKTKWDFVIVDEAHEGTTTELGDNVIKSIVKKNSKYLALSGTPFNIMEGFSDANTYTWDYVDEQRAKADWYKNNPDSNPYEDLPAMKIFTYNLGEVFSNADYVDVEEMSFNFREFFKTDGENFVHAADVQKFLNLLVATDENNYPYSSDEFRKIFRHTLWIIPGVKEGKALSKLLQGHKVFSGFKIVNVAGNGDTDDEPADALKKVKDAIANHTYTITLSCGKLTAGVTVPEWTAVFMLRGGSNQNYKTSAASYLQTIFRVQSPCNKGGLVKQNCYVFDFAPDRTLTMLTAYAKISTRPGKATSNDRQKLGELLNFCPVISLDGSKMQTYNADKLFKRLKRAYIERTVQRGFDDNYLYNDELLKLDKLDLTKFDKLKKIIGTSKKKSGDIDINSQGLDNEQYKKTPGEKTPRTEEQKELDRRKKIRRDAISILRGISIRMPLLIYGADIPLEKDFEIEMFFDDEIVDDASWAEFMPAGVSKDFFRDFIKFYDKDIFLEAGRRIRQLAKEADDRSPAQRVQKIADIFSTFKNPDKETVLTPYDVVKLHIDSTFDKNFFSPDKRILEINSKSGLYPLYVAYKIYSARLGDFREDDFKPKALLDTWDKIVADNIFVICKTPMAEKITRRTLVGFRPAQVNAKHFADLIPTLKNLPDIFIKRVLSKSFWQKGGGKMFFDAVVGNPPYQNSSGAGTSNFATSVYHLFMENSFKLADKVSLITPARFLFNTGATPKDFNERMLNNPHLKVVDYRIDSKDFFPTSDIKGGVVITLYDKNQNFGAIKLFIPFDELIGIHKKVVLDNKNFQPLNDIIYSQKSFKLTKKFHEDNPEAVKSISEGQENDFSTIIMSRFPKLFFDEKPNDGHEYIQVHGLTNNKRVCKYFRRDWVNTPVPLDKWKVFVPKANGSGALGEVLSTPFVSSPLVGATQTFITVGAFDTRAEAEACLAYIKSKFCRTMLGILKITQDNTRDIWAKVPLQDFTAASDINWRVPIAEIDKQLYAKYKLSDAEIKFIEEKVRAM